VEKVCFGRLLKFSVAPTTWLDSCDWLVRITVKGWCRGVILRDPEGGSNDHRECEWVTAKYIRIRESRGAKRGRVEASYIVASWREWVQWLNRIERTPKALTSKARWRAPKSRGETHLRVPQSQVTKSWDLVARSQLPTLERGRGSSWEPRD